jgi:hypothetical protein
VSRRVVNNHQSSSLSRQTENGDALHTTPEAARILGKAAHSLECWRSLQKGPRVTYEGRRVYYLHSDLIDYMRGGCAV